MDIKTMVLGFLMRGSMTGYELKKRFSLSFSFFSALSYGSIYPALKKLEQEGLITLKVEVQDGSPNRKVYTITDSGRKAFLEDLRTPFTLERQKSAFLARLFFFAHLTREERLATASRYLESIKEMQKTLAVLEPEIRDRADDFQYLSYSFGIRFFDDLARNVKQVLQELEGKKAEDKIPSPQKGPLVKGKEGAP
jgi:DNA-binding PadR family transcriptional regulator